MAVSVRQSGRMVDGRGVQPGREGRDKRGADCEREQGDEHAGCLRPEHLVTVAQPLRSGRPHRAPEAGSQVPSRPGRLGPPW